MTEQTLFSQAELNDLDLTRLFRTILINDSMENNKIKVNDTKRLEVILKAADGLDRQVLEKAKRRTEKESMGTNNEIKSMIADLLLDTSMKKIKSSENDRIIELDSSIELPTIQEGELTIGNVSTSYDEFIKK